MTEPLTESRRTAVLIGWVQHTTALLAAAVFVKLVLAVGRFGVEAMVPGPRLAGWLFRDALTAVLWGAIAAVMLFVAGSKRRPVAGGLAAVVVLLAAYMGINIAFFRAFSTPLNRGMMGMAGGVGDLGESAAQLITLHNVWPVVAVAVLTAAMLLVARSGPRIVAGVSCIVLAFSLGLGVWGLDTTDARGLDRNAVWELALLGLPESEPLPPAVGDDERVGQPIPRGSIVEPGAPGPDLESLRGAAADMNLIYVIMESTSAEYLGLYGAEDDPTPNVSRIAETALVFDSWYSVTPASMKSLFSTLCSTWPYPRPTAETYVRPQIPCHSLPEVLALNGFRSSLVHSGKFSYTRKSDFLEGRGFESLWDMRSLPQDDDDWSDSWGIEEEVSVAQMERFLDDVGDDRFFLMYMPIFPHYPYNLPDDETPRFGDEDSKQKYLSAMAYADRNLGVLYDAVAERGLLDNTLFVLVGDHGEAFRQHRGNTIHSTSIYEENVHVPALWSNPRLFPQTRRIDTPADHTTMAPSLLDLMGLPTPDRWQGRSMFDGERQMAHFFTDYSFLYLGLRDGPYKFIHQVQTGNTQLYDLTTDPRETEDLSAAHPELVGQYTAHLDHWYVRQLALFADYEGFVDGTLADDGVVLLQDLVPVDVEHGDKKTRFGISVNHKALRINGREFPTGLGMHADGHTRYALNGQYTTFSGAVGRNDKAHDGQAIAELWVDDTLAFTSGPLTRRTDAVRFQIDVTGAETLELRALQGDDGLDGDYVDWVDASIR